MLKPRNTLVLVQLVEKAEQKVGDIVISDNATMFDEAKIVAVGPGIADLPGGQTPTHDLRPGQRVLVQSKAWQQGATGRHLGIAGIRYVSEGQVYYIFEQTSVLAIIAEADAVPTDKVNLTTAASSGKLQLVH